MVVNWKISAKISEKNSTKYAEKRRWNFSEHCPEEENFQQLENV